MCLKFRLGLNCPTVVGGRTSSRMVWEEWNRLVANAAVLPLAFYYRKLLAFFSIFCL